MKIERKLIPEMSITEFADQNELTMVVTERARPPDDPGRFYATFKDATFKDGGRLVGTFGDGPTEEEAIQDYARAISLQRLVIRAASCARRELDVPRLTKGTP